MADEMDGDEQDLAETFDETHREDEESGVYDPGANLDPDMDADVYDAVSALGDEDEDGEENEDLDDLDDDDLDDEDLDDDEEDDVEVIRGDGLAADAADGDDLVRSDRRSRIIPGPDEADISTTEDLDSVAAPRDRQADKFESNGPLSDQQIADLGYGERK